MNKGTPYPLLRPSFVALLKVVALELAEAERVLSRKQWSTAKMLLDEWNNGDYEGEITKDEFYAEASRCICDALGFAFVSLSGETVKVWCEVFAQFENTPETLKEQLPFAYFRNARYLFNQKKVAVPIFAITVALDHKLTAAEMVRWFNDPPVILPLILELRKQYPSYLWGAVDVLASMNGNQQQAAWHLQEFARLYEEDAK